VRFINGYGPTETTTFAAHHGVEESSLAPAAARVPIGHPIRGTALYILDRHLSPVPRGVAGELWIGGVGLADGYVGRPEQTASVFAADPFSPVPGSRMYRSGDLARRRPDGAVDYLGRVDRQLKLRGFRIEPGEVEAALRAVAGVDQVHVAARTTPLPGGGEDRALYAWVVLPAAPDDDVIRGWRTALMARLPEWLTPRRIGVVDAFPLTPNGKLDQAALMTPVGDDPLDGTTAVDIVYGTETERQLAAIWSELLGGGVHGPEDGFFASGGHSLLGVRLLALIRQRFKVAIPLRQIFEKPILSQMAKAIEEAIEDAGGGDQDLDEIQANDWPGDERPVSSMQARLALMDQIDGSGLAYAVPIASLFGGVLDRDALGSALQALADRHETLRCVVRIDEDIRGVLLSADRNWLKVENHPAMDRDAARTFTEDAARRLARIPFDLATEAPLRGYLLDFGGERSALILIVHHIAVDGHSIPILLRDLASFYDAALTGEAGNLPPLPFRYADWTAWRQSQARLEQDDAAIAEAKETLTGAPHMLDLPADFPRPAQRNHEGRVETFAIAPALECAMNARARDLSTTPFVLLAAAYAVLLARTTGAEDIVFGVPFDGRDSLETGELVGFFADTAVVRAKLDDDPDAVEIVSRLYHSLTRAISRPAPLDRLIEAMDIQRDTSHTPLFQAMIAFNEEAQTGNLFGSLESEPLLVHPGTAKFDLQLQILKQDGKMVCALEYAADLFTPETAQALSSRYLRVLEWLSCGGVGGFGAVPLVAPSERAWLLDEVNDRARDYGPFVPVHGAFEALARAEPERPAVRFEGMEIGYGELNTRANGLAHRLRRAGVGRDVRVGVALERSVELVVALLAVVKAGGAYVPLDPELPADRLSFMISDADAAVVVTRTGLLETLPLHDGRTICIDDGARSGRRGLASDDLEIALEPDDLAYVIYTSGSTGRPKGVMNSHGGLRNRLMWMQDAFPIGAEDRVLQKTPYTFDVSVWEFFWPLMRGATIVVAKPEGHRDPDYLAGLLHDEGVTVLHFVPSMLQAFLGHEPSAALLGDCWALRYVICSGEALSPGLADRFHGFAPDGASLHNLYGPTEAAIDVTHWPCCDPSADPLPIGHGIANTRLYVLDSAHEPVPVGVAGDLWIGGVQVARGYVRRPGLTAESFIADPHGPVPGGRMYRTGDLARRRADGALEYLGRRDFQVKLRGFRIELGEIESVLLNHGGIRSGAVLLREDRAGDPRLVGYIVPEGGVLPGDLEAYLRDRLADYMVPSDWVVLDALPVTANGKLDRGALPAPDLRTGVGSGRPRGPEEEVCCAVFASVLGRENVGVEDNFFALGGHSLLAVQVVGRLRRALQVELPANAVFAHASPRLLAAHIQNARHLKTTPINKRKP
ncbi:MAG: amino acid adenylation domain-containing protein, partial [Rhodospirillaceae bacterium]|nr:amino acid adenylation domain-containing protein [Rhodospirillaceae bacterium]